MDSLSLACLDIGKGVTTPSKLFEQPYSVYTQGAVDNVCLEVPWLLLSRVISRVTILITHIRGLISPLTP